MLPAMMATSSYPTETINPKQTLPTIMYLNLGILSEQLKNN